MRGQLLALGILTGVGIAWIPAAVSLAAPPAARLTVVSPARSVSGAAIVGTALQYLGYPYTTVGSSPAKGFSCIGFVSYVYQSNAIPLPDDLWMAQAYASPVPFNNLLPGDILFFQDTIWKGLSHTAIYLGGGRFVHAEWYNRGVVTSSFNNDPTDGNYWIKKYLGANRPWTGAPGSVLVSTGANAVTGTTTPAVMVAGGTPDTVSVPALNMRASPSQGSGVLQVLTPASAVIKVSALRVHVTPAIRAPVIAVLSRGQRVTVATYRNGWVQIRLPNGVTGWVSAQLLEGTAPSAVITVSASRPGMTTARVRVHSAPGVDAPVLTIAPAGTKVTVLSKKGSWLLIRLPVGTTGYVAAGYVR